MEGGFSYITKPREYKFWFTKRSTKYNYVLTEAGQPFVHVIARALLR